jgi:hypothetical protein
MVNARGKGVIGFVDPSEALRSLSMLAWIFIDMDKAIDRQIATVNTRAVLKLDVLQKSGYSSHDHPGQTTTRIDISWNNPLEHSLLIIGLKLGH